MAPGDSDVDGAPVGPPAHVVGRGDRVAAHPPVRGEVWLLEDADDVLDLLDADPAAPVALVRDAGATFLAPVFPLLTAVVCTGGTLRSHIGIVTRDYGIPCVMGCRLERDLVQGEPVEVDLSEPVGVVRAARPGDRAVEPPAADAAAAAAVPPPLAGAVVVPPLPRLAPRGDVTTAAGRRRRADELLAYHSPIAHRLTSERTSYSSQLIPVTPYIIVSCAEAFLRYPAMMRTIDAARPAETLGALGRTPGSRINTVYLWSVANFFLVGRKVLCGIDPSFDDPEAAFTVLDFWERAAAAFRADGTHQAADDGTARPYDASVLDAALGAVVPVDDDLRRRIGRWNASLVNHLFLLHFDTRVGHGDTGPYPVPGHPNRTVVLRDLYLHRPDLWWSDVAAKVPYRHLLAAFVVEDTDVRITDFGTVVTDPEDYLDRVVGFSLLTTDDEPPGGLRPVPLDELEPLAAVCDAARDALYRRIATMTPRARIDCGAQVYFGFLRPFAEAAGVADALDWTVPAALDAPVVDLLIAAGEQLGDSEMAAETPEGYYPPLA